jgi:uncharacterized protein
MDDTSFLLVTAVVALTGLTVCYIADIYYSDSHYSENFHTDQVAATVADLFKANNVDDIHGMGHTLEVLKHARLAMDETPPFTQKLDPRQRVIIELSCLLHDIDDRKYFQSDNYQNARTVIREIFPELETDVIKCIELVSTSQDNDIEQNGFGAAPEWMYIPRYANHLDAMGLRGIERAIAYGRIKNIPMHLPNTLQLKQHHKLIAFIEETNRFELYKKTRNSESVIDHFYDKLLHLYVGTRYRYINIEMRKRHNVMIAWVLDYWESQAHQD